MPAWWQRLRARIPVRLDPGRRAAVAVGLAVVVAAVLTGAWVVAERPRALAVATSPPPIPGASSPVATGAPSPRAPGSTSPTAVTSSSPTVVVVDVAGKVRRPGLYRLPVGSRVDDAVRAAGGALAGVDLSSLNLAAKVVDGQQIPVGIRGSPGGVVGGSSVGGPAGGPAGGSVGGGAGAGGGLVDLNAATVEQLDALPGVGPVLAQHILDWRTAHGRFATVDQLDDVTGIGEVKFTALKPLVTV
ncbi:MAG: competence protein ComEA [Pseudonocardiales bacterium]|nr:competence protein ComEA [Pseudonocardiales bacterium]